MPLDEMPLNMVFRGVSRVISPSETQGMTSCGVSTKRAECWAIESLGQDQPVKDPEINQKIRKMLVDVLKLENIPAAIRQDVSNLIAKGIEALDVTTPAAQSMAVVPAPPIQTCLGTGVVNHQKPQGSKKKEFCSYWIRHGECDYQQQGCLFRHAMPTQPEALEKLGLRDIPRWYREKFNLASVLQQGGPRLQQPFITMDALPATQKAIQYADHSEGTQSTHAAMNHHGHPHHSQNPGYQYPRGDSWGEAQSPSRGGYGGSGMQGRGRGGHPNGPYYKNGQSTWNPQVTPQSPSQPAIGSFPVHNAPTGPSAQPAIGSFRVGNFSTASRKRPESTFAQVAARAGGLATPETSPSVGSSNCTNNSGGSTVNISQSEHGVGNRSQTHKVIHESIMNPEEAVGPLTQGMGQLDCFGLPPVTKTEEDFRRGHRRLFAPGFGHDGADSWCDVVDDFVDVFEDPAFAEIEAIKQLVSSDAARPESSLLNALVAESEPLENKRALANWGPIGVKTKQPASTKASAPPPANMTEISKLKETLSEIEGAPDLSESSAIDMARLSYRMSSSSSFDGDNAAAASWFDLAYKAHAKAAFAWRRKVNGEFGSYSPNGPDVYTTWRRKRGIEDYPYVTGSRTKDLACGFRVPFPAPRECARRDSWLRLQKRLMRECAHH
ncbi:hypothetical protein N7481_009814 [Penicillium waksmanii]|uniref:uncharacterized protein n=1 Tax=Penicillium waksmanii TaxID=69791 RepID=UPI00254772D0|nr:uncharacterized protein N7481_009814 [Penicillium waksmanii]KAJ5976107.1 hypothetical protein N7481_009814 [Penicillium waksmanii]